MSPGCLCNLLAQVHSVAVGQSEFSEALELGFHETGWVVSSKEPHRKPIPCFSFSSLALVLALMKTQNSKIRI